jgi:hypothetical protein
MSRPHGYLLVFALLGFGLLAAARDADACDCDGPGAPCQLFYDAPAVFTGTVQSIRSLGAKSGDGRRAHFVVVESFKGVATQEIDIDTGRDFDDCAVPFKAGETYFVYARIARDGASLETRLCMRTRPLKDAAFDLSFARSAAGAPETGGVIFGTAGNLDQPLPGRVVGDGTAAADDHLKIRTCTPVCQSATRCSRRAPEAAPI